MVVVKFKNLLQMSIEVNTSHNAKRISYNTYLYHQHLQIFFGKIRDSKNIFWRALRCEDLSGTKQFVIHPAQLGRQINHSNDSADKNKNVLVGENCAKMILSLFKQANLDMYYHAVPSSGKSLERIFGGILKFLCLKMRTSNKK